MILCFQFVCDTLNTENVLPVMYSSRLSPKPIFVPYLITLAPSFTIKMILGGQFKGVSCSPIKHVLHSLIWQSVSWLVWVSWGLDAFCTRDLSCFVAKSTDTTLQNSRPVSILDLNKKGTLPGHAKTNSSVSIDRFWKRQHVLPTSKPQGGDLSRWNGFVYL